MTASERVAKGELRKAADPLKGVYDKVAARRL
jgi:hypothetical protein